MGRILVVEDDLIIASGLVRIIRSLDEKIGITTTGYSKEALEHAKHNHYDAFLLDIQLKDYSGLKLAKEIRSLDRYKLVPIVFITSIPTKELLAFKEIHCYDYIIKPFQDEEVLQVVKTILEYGISKDRKPKTLKVKQKDYNYVIKQDEIVYIETVNRKLSVVTINEQITLSTYTLSQIMSELTPDFVQCHKGFVVNTQYIQKIDKVNDLVELKEVGASIPLGRKYKDNLRGNWT